MLDSRSADSHAGPAPAGPSRVVRQPPTEPSRRRSRFGVSSAEGLIGYLFLLPWLLGFVCLTLGPMAASFWISFTRYGLLSSPEWVGLRNYVQLATADPRYLQSVKVTIAFVGTSVPLKLIGALLLATLLNRKMRGLGVYRTAYYVPSLLGGSVAISLLWRQLFGSEGLVNQSLAVFGIHGPSWISDPRFAVDVIVLLAIWQVGAPMIIFLAGLKEIPGELYEAATVDGASPLRQFQAITLPLITPLIFFNLVLQVIGSFQAFNPAFIISGGTGGPVDSTLFYTLYLYDQAFIQFHMGYASAMAWILFAIIAGATAINFFGSRYWVYYQDREERA